MFLKCNIDHMSLPNGAIECLSSSQYSMELQYPAKIAHYFMMINKKRQM